MSTETETAKKTPTKTRQGVVRKNKADKTVVVEVMRRVQHPKYPKFVKKRRRYMAHDAQNQCDVGDTVLLEETRPLSKNKRWRVKEILQKAAGL